MSKLDSKTLALSASGLKRTGFCHASNSIFTFTVTPRKEYVCSTSQACYISPKVHKLLLADPTVSSLCLITPDPLGYFALIQSLWNGSPIEITNQNADFLRTVSAELENDEIRKFVIDFELRAEPLSMKNALKIFELKREIQGDLDDELEFIASNFSKFSEDKIASLSVASLEMILSHPSLAVKTENDLFSLLKDLVSRNASYGVLLRRVKFQYLDKKHLELFLDLAYPEYIDGLMWKKIKKYICSAADEVRPPRRPSRFTGSVGEYHKYNEKNPFEGIFWSLRKTCADKNPHKEGLVTVTSSGDHDRERPCYRVLDRNWGHWPSKNEPNSWIQFDFMNKSVCLECYAMKSDACVDMKYHLHSWILLGSNDTKSWQILDAQMNTDTLLGAYKVGVYHRNAKHDEFFRYFKIVATGPAYGLCDYNFRLAEVEFFGILK